MVLESGECIGIVGGGHDGGSRVGEPSKLPVDGVRTVGVETRGRFVEQQDRGLLGKRLCQQGALALTAR